MGNVRRVTLPNGLRVVAFEMPQLSYVAVRLVVCAGSRDDPREKAGISHFVEHLLFRGTERHPHEAALRAHIASLGGVWNAQTSKEWTSLELSVPKENIAPALETLAEILLAPTFNGFEVERRIVMEEMSDAYDENDGTLWPFPLFADARMWPYNGIGIPTIGEPRTVLGITLDDAKEYVGRHYRGGGIALGIAGAFELEALRASIECTFGALRAGTPETARKAPLLQRGAMHWMDRPWSPRAEVRMMFPFGPRDARGFIAAWMVQTLLATNGVGRIHNVLRSRAGIAYAADSALDVYSDCARLTVIGELKKEKMPQMVGEVARTLRDLRHRGPTEAELEAARVLLLRDLRASLDVAEAAAAEYAHADARGLPPPEEAIAIAESLTMDEITELVRAVFRTKHAIIAVAGARDDDDQRTAWQMFESALGE